MNLEDLIKKVNDAVQDSGCNDDDIITLLNEGALVIAEAVRLPYLSAGSGTITTDASCQTTMPATYLKDVYRCMDGTRELNIRNNIEELLIVYAGDLTNAGPVMDVVIQGGKFIYQPIPAAPVTLTLYFTELPASLVKDIDIPVFLPSVKYHKALAYYAISELYDDIEDGLELQEGGGGKVNTQIQRAKFEAELDKIFEAVSNFKTKKG